MDNEMNGGICISGGTVNTENIAGRDINIGTRIPQADLDRAFQSVMDAIEASQPGRQSDAAQKLVALKMETAKGKRANHDLMTKLAEGIVDLVPSALSALAGAFAKPVLSGVAGPVTQFLLKKITGQ